MNYLYHFLIQQRKMINRSF